MKKPNQTFSDLRPSIIKILIVLIIAIITTTRTIAGTFYISLPADTTICYNGNITITASYEITNKPAKWIWSNGDTTKLAITLKGVKVNTVVHLTAWDTLGNLASDTIIIGIKALPNISFSTVPPACSNDTGLIDLDLYVNPKGGNWYSDSNFLVGHSFSPLLAGKGSFWPRYNYTDLATGCSDTDYINVFVNDAPVASFIPKTSGGTAPVLIDFVNNSSTSSGAGMDFLWDFGDGQFSTVKNPTHMFTIPGNMNVCLVVTDTLTGCSDRYCRTVNIQPYPGYLQLAGYVFAGGQKASKGKVLLYKQYEEGTDIMYKVTDSTTIADSNGFYSFSSIDSGIYLVKAVLKEVSPFYGTWFPTYLGDVIFWNKTSPITIYSNLSGQDIHLVKGYKISGQAGIQGKTMSKGSAVNDIQLILTDIVSNPVMYDFSATDGSFNLDNLSFGSYLLHTEITGIKTYPMEVILDEQHSKYENFSIEISSQAGTGINSYELMVFSTLFPNPGYSFVCQKIISAKAYCYQINISDQNGKILLKQTGKIIPGSNEIYINLDEITPGFYIYNLTVDEKLMLREKLLKIK